jgi:hypothetical protein
VSADYFLEIESHFARRRGTPFVLNAKDWALMKKWAEDGIPLPIVIEALDSVFDKQEAKGRKVNSLSYCKHAVKELWGERRDLQVGSEETAPEESPGPRLEALAAELEVSSDATAQSYAPRVRELIREKSVPRIEEALMELEGELIAALASPELREDAETLGAGAPRSVEAHLRRLVRERHGLPRLTLF